MRVRPAVAGVFDRRREQGVVGVAMARRSQGPPPLRGGEPVALPLEGIGRQRDALCARAREEGAPLDPGPGSVGVGERPRQGTGLGPPLAQGRHEGGGVLIPQALPRLRAEHRVGAELDIGAGSLRLQGLDRIGEAHRLAGLADPVGGVGGLLWAEQLSGEVGDDRDAAAR